MNRQLIIWLIICLNGTEYLQAQWTENDSLRLRSVLEGRDSIRLNPETLKAIEDGTLLNRENPFNELLEAPPILPITKDFWDIAPEDTTKANIDFGSLPPSVAILKEYLNDTLKIRDGAFDFHLKTHERDQFQVGKLPITVYAGAQDLHEKEVRDGQKRGTVGATTRVYFSLDDILTFIFRKSERQKKKNKKNAERLKNYAP